MLRVFTLLSLLCFAVAPVTASFAQLPVVPVASAKPTPKELVDVTAAFSAFVALFKDKKELPDPVLLDKASQKVEDEAQKVVAIATVKEEHKTTALGYAMISYNILVNLDRGTYLPKLKKLGADIVAKFPGTELASNTDGFILMHEVSNDRTVHTENIRKYAKTYPTSQLAAMIILSYAERLKTTEPTAVAEFIEEGLKIFPGNAEIIAYKTASEKVGKPVALTGTLLNGKSFDIKDFKGKVVVLDFWATWCPPCRAMTPKLLKMHDDLNSKGLEIVGISHDNSSAPLEKYVKDHSIPWTMIFEAAARDRNALANKWGVRGIPTLFVVGKDGNLATSGTHSFEQLQKQVDEAMKK